MRTVVADGESRHRINIGYVTVESVYDVESPEIPNDPRLKKKITNITDDVFQHIKPMYVTKSYHFENQ